MAKKNAKRLGALGLAGALAFGGIVAASPASAAPKVDRVVGPIVLPFGSKDKPGSFVPRMDKSVEGLLNGRRHERSTMAEALEMGFIEGAQMSFPAEGLRGPVMREGKCLSRYPDSPGYLQFRLCTGKGDQDFEFQKVPDEKMLPDYPEFTTGLVHVSSGLWVKGFGTGGHVVSLGPKEHAGALALATGLLKPAVAPLVVAGPTQGSVVESQPLVVSGTAEPGAKVTVVGPDGAGFGETIADEAGGWSVILPKQPAGEVSITVHDDYGNEVKIDFTIEDVPVILVAFPSLTVDTQRPTLSGAGHTGAQVEVKDQDGTSLGTTTVAEDGTWSLTPTSDLAKGPNQLTAVQTPKDGGETSEASATITVNVVDQLAVSGPTAGSTVTTDKPVVTGTSEPKADITITDKDGKVIGTTTANAKGEWSITLPAQPNGLVEITVTDEHGQKVDHSFTVDVAAPIAELIITGPKEG
ncbi:Ig-like domain-containing protein, partial [Leucobacter sp. Ag1]|uniref:Ig-like domain-containing protein n=6 Tax=Leucobacter TaxID=55968 RepID=UPI0018CCCE31